MFMVAVLEKMERVQASRVSAIYLEEVRFSEQHESRFLTYHYYYSTQHNLDLVVATERGTATLCLLSPHS